MFAVKGSRRHTNSRTRGDQMKLRASIAAGAAFLAIAVPMAAAAVINGTDNPEILYGTNRADQISAGAGGDVVNGLKGHDRIGGGAGADMLSGARGHDWVAGNEDDDVVRGGYGHDRLFGQQGDDVVEGAWGHDVALGGSGNDRVFGGPGFDTLYAGPGEDMLFGGRGHDVLIARADDNQVDFLICGPGWDIAYARANDVIHRSCERKVVVGGTETEPGDEEALPAPEARLSGDPNAGQTDPSDEDDHGKR